MAKKKPLLPAKKAAPTGDVLGLGAGHGGETHQVAGKAAATNPREHA